jgi:hypothetical protein
MRPSYPPTTKSATLSRQVDGAPPRYAHCRLTTTLLARADLCLRSGSGARPDGTVRLPRRRSAVSYSAQFSILYRVFGILRRHGSFALYGIRALRCSGPPLYLPVCRRDRPHSYFCTKVAATGTTEAGQTDGDPAEQGGDWRGR